jgi:hypothetical protein
MERNSPDLENAKRLVGNLEVLEIIEDLKNPEIITLIRDVEIKINSKNDTLEFYISKEMFAKLMPTLETLVLANIAEAKANIKT